MRTKVVVCDLPLLLSKEPAKRTKINIDISTDIVTILGSRQKLLFTSPGHYCVPLGHHISVVEEESSMLQSEYVLFGEEFKQELSVKKRKIISKLHQQFSHNSSERIKGLLKNASATDEKCFKILDEITASCDICKIH